MTVVYRKIGIVLKVNSARLICECQTEMIKGAYFVVVVVVLFAAFFTAVTLAATILKFYRSYHILIQELYYNRQLTLIKYFHVCSVEPAGRDDIGRQDSSTYSYNHMIEGIFKDVV